VIDVDELLDVVEGLFRDGGLEGVSIERAANELGVSRATLYRAVSSKERLLGLLLERLTAEIDARAQAAVEDTGRSARERLHALLRHQFDAAIRMREYLFLFFGPSWMEHDRWEEWRRWSREYEDIWRRAVTAAAAEGAIRINDPVIATRLVLGMCLWVSRWYRPSMQVDPDQLADEAMLLLGGTSK
jgi:AcrR family transcriptional regulator